VVETTRKVTQLVDSFVTNDKETAQKLVDEIGELEEEVDDIGRVVAQELSKIGGVLTSREDFLRFTNQTGEIADFCEGIAFRLLEIMEKGWAVTPELKEGLMRLSEKMFETISKLRETAIALNYSSTKALEKAAEVERAERVVDEIYRELEIKIINAKLKIPVLLLLRDVVKMLEDLTDKAEDASDAARILALTM
jgi:predicted phosphate transport protein (TIGR00153 family)